MVKKLKGVVFVAQPSDVSSTTPKVIGLQTNGIPVLQSEDFPAVIQPYLGQPVTMTSLNAMIKAVILYSRQHDRPVVDVIVPDQEITSGVVQLVYLEGRLGQVQAEGNHWFSSDTIEGEVRLRPGQEISANQLMSDVAWINQNPFISTEAVFTPGSRLGLTNAVLETRDRFPVRFYGGYEDSGNGRHRLRSLRGGGSIGVMPFTSANSLIINTPPAVTPTVFAPTREATSSRCPGVTPSTFFGTYIDTRAIVPPLAGITGRSYQISGRYGIPLLAPGPRACGLQAASSPPGLIISTTTTPLNSADSLPAAPCTTSTSLS